MASDDFYSFSARQRLQQINAYRAQCLADLEQCKVSNDYEGAANSVQQIANLEAEKQNLVSLHDQYIRSQQVPEPPELTPEQKHALPWDRMSLQDGLDLAKQSKYGKDLSFDDPKNVIAGYHHMLANRGK